MDVIMVRGTPRGFPQDSTKSILVVSKPNLVWVESFYQGERITIVTWSRYLGVYIGDANPQSQWLGEKVQDWEGGIRTLSGVVCKHLQENYAGLQKSLQQE